MPDHVVKTDEPLLPGQEATVCPQHACYVNVRDTISGFGCSFSIVAGQGFIVTGGNGVDIEVTLEDLDREPVITRPPRSNGDRH